jgi:hypothetical protein
LSVQLKILPPNLKLAAAVSQLLKRTLFRRQKLIDSLALYWNRLKLRFKDLNFLISVLKE